MKNINKTTKIINKNYYITINYKKINKNIETILKKELLNLYKYLKIKESDSVLIIGLGNNEIICDSLGSLVIDEIIVTRNIINARSISTLKPNVSINTGITSYEIIQGVIKETKPSLLIIIDSLSTKILENLEHQIQINTKEINPGSGVGNHQKKLNKKNLKTKLITIGIPLVYKEKNKIYILKDKQTVKKLSKIIAKAINSSLLN